jgi:hypothetical protein
MATLGVSPSKVSPNQTKLITWIGAGTSWVTGNPVFTPSGDASSGLMVGSVTIVSDTIATAMVTYGTATGTLTWTVTDNVGSATVNQIVGTLIRWMPGRAYS